MRTLFKPEYFIRFIIFNILSINLVQMPLAAYIWKNVAINGGGFVSGIVTHPTQPGVIYARTDVGGAYRLDSTGTRWLSVTDWIGKDDWSLTGIESIALDPLDGNRLYLAAGMYTNNWTSINGAILRSFNQGSTFDRINLPFKMGGNEDGRSIGERLAVDPNKNNILYFGTRTSGLWMSTDSASTWSKVTSFPVRGYPGGVGIGFVVFNSYTGSSGNLTPVIYVGVADTTGNSLYRSTDCGTTWQAVPGQPSPGVMPHHAVIASNSTLYLTYCNGPGPNGISSGAVWKYNSISSTWTNITPPTGQGGFAGLSLDADNPNKLVVTTMDRWWPHDEIYRSLDGGSTWSEVWGQWSAIAVWDTTSAPYSGSVNPHWTGDIEIDPTNPNRAFFITGFGIWACHDLLASDTNQPTHWAFFNNGLEETVPLEITSPPFGAQLLSVVGDYDGFKHDNLDIPSPIGRFTPNMGTSNGIDFAQNSPNIIVRVGSSNGYGYYSLDSGNTWTVFGSTPSGTNSGSSLAVSADGSRFVWAPSGGALSYSTTNGTTWISSTGGVNGQKVTADRVNANKFYIYNTNNGRVYRSTDGGATFSQPTTITGGGKLRAVPGNEGDLWLTRYGSGLYRSTNSGSSFSVIASVQEAYEIGFGKASTGLTYPAVYLWGKVGGVFGYFRSDNNGTSWVRINDDQHNYAYINGITGDPRVYGRIYIATGGRGIIYGEPENQTNIEDWYLLY